MAIKDGEVVEADDLLSNFLAKQFRNYLQAIWNADYIGWNANLDYDFEAGSGGSPSFTNLIWDNFNGNGQGVASASNMVLDTSTKTYHCVEADEADLVYVDIYASNVNEAYLTDATYNVSCVQLASGVWRVYSNNSDVEKSMNGLFAVLSNQCQLASGASSPHGVTSMTSMRISEATYRSHSWVSCDCLTGNGHAAETAQMQWSGASDTRYAMSDFGHTNLTSGNSTSAWLRYGNGGWSNWHSNTTGSYPSSWSFDDRASTGIHSTNAENIQFYSVQDGGGTSSSRGVVMWLTSDTGTIMESNSRMSAAMAISGDAPDTATYPVNTSNIITTALSASVTNGMPTWNSAVDAANAETFYVSADGGSNWESATKDTIVRLVNAGGSCQIKWQDVRADLSKKDSISEWGFAYNMGAGSG